MWPSLSSSSMSINSATKALQEPGERRCNGFKRGVYSVGVRNINISSGRTDGLANWLWEAQTFEVVDTYALLILFQGFCLLFSFSFVR